MAHTMEQKEATLAFGDYVDETLAAQHVLET